MTTRAPAVAKNSNTRQAHAAQFGQSTFENGFSWSECRALADLRDYIQAECLLIMPGCLRLCPIRVGRHSCINKCNDAASEYQLPLERHPRVCIFTLHEILPSKPLRTQDGNNIAIGYNSFGTILCFCLWHYSQNCLSNNKAPSLYCIQEEGQP